MNSLSNRLTLLLISISLLVMGCKDSNNEPEINLFACEEVFGVVEEMPELIGGQSGLQERLQYPSVAERAGIEGRVTVEFVVNKLGDPDSSRVIRGIGGGCDAESLRLVQTTKWEPGKQRGELACVRMSLPVIFKLTN